MCFIPFVRPTPTSATALAATVDYDETVITVQIPGSQDNKAEPIVKPSEAAAAEKENMEQFGVVTTPPTKKRTHDEAFAKPLPYTGAKRGRKPGGRGRGRGGSRGGRGGSRKGASFNRSLSDRSGH